MHLRVDLNATDLQNMKLHLMLELMGNTCSPCWDSGSFARMARSM